jgi:nitrate reductase NapE component
MDAVSCTASSANLGTHCKSTSKWPGTNYRVFFFSWVMENQDLDRKNSEWALFFFFSFFLFFVVTVDFYYKDGNYGEI